MISRRPTWTALSLALPFAFAAGCGGDDTGDTSITGGTTPGGGTIAVQITGEEIATDGFLFPTGSEVVLSDGWEMKFTHVLVTVGKITVAENPDKAPTDQSQIDAVVAEYGGPWAVDLHVEGSAPGAGGAGKATPLVTLDKQNMNGDEPFDSDRRYAFGYDLVVASSTATKVNFAGDAETEAAYAEMAAAGYSVMYVGTATFKGGATCATPAGSTYDWSAVPTTVPFKLGFATPVTNINCQNESNQGDAFPDEEYQRGIAIPANTAATAQITLHVEHPFFSDVEHDPLVFFGQMAAQLVGEPAGTTLTIDDLVGVDPTAFTDGAGVDLPWRTCDGSPLPATTQMGFEVGSVPVNPAGQPAEALRDYRDYVHYVQSTLGHLNGGEGLCFVKRNFPSPP